MSKFKIPLEVLQGLPENITNPVLPTSESLKNSGVYPHFEGTEIETKLEVSGPEQPGEEILKTLQTRLEQSGYTFPDPQIVVRENYVVYYSKEDGSNSKIIAKNLGESGFQVKSRSKDGASSDHISIKKELPSNIFNSFAEAESYLASELGVDKARQNITSIIKVIKHKLTLAAKGDDSVTRFFRLIVDESSIPAEAEHSPQEKLRQIELEYKGSDREDQDDLATVQAQMEKIVEVMMLEQALSLKRTNRSKRKWSAQRSQPVM